MFTLRWFLGLEFGLARRHYIIVSLRSDDGEILRRQTWSRGLGVRSPSQWREK